MDGTPKIEVRAQGKPSGQDPKESPRRREDAVNEKFIEVLDFNFFYGLNQTLHNISLNIKEKHVTALIGPSGCGKSTLLRMFNRMNDLIPTMEISSSTCAVITRSSMPSYLPQRKINPSSAKSRLTSASFMGFACGDK